jgi:NADH dehydrogenase (ubiquinone) Fe-S protein 3
MKTIPNSIKYFEWLSQILSNSCNVISLKNNDITIRVSSSQLRKVILFLSKHSNCQYEILSDISGIDFPIRSKRFEVVYILLSVRYSHRIIVKVAVSELDLGVPSLCSIYPAANWYEREVFDIFGIVFLNHPDIRRLLTDYGFEGFPLRKDFPLSGYFDLRYDSGKKRIVCNPIELSQDFRNLFFSGKWFFKNILKSSSLNICLFVFLLLYFWV